MNKIDELSVEGLRLIDDLLKTKSLKRTANNIHISNPASVRLLAKLRNIFDDELFTRNGSQMLPTAMTLSIRDDVIRSLNLLDRINQRSIDFNPANLRRVFKIAIHETIFVTHFKQVCKEVFAAAPNVKIETHGIVGDLIGKLKTGELDFVIMPLDEDYSEEIKVLPVADMSWKILVRKNHPILKKAVHGKISPKEISKLPKVQLIDRSFKFPDGVDSWVMRNYLIRQDTKLWAPYIAPILDIIRTSDLTYLVYSRLADIICASDKSLQSIDVGGEAGKFQMALKWHENLDSDVACQWFRSLLVSIFRSAPSPSKSAYFVPLRFPK